VHEHHFLYRPCVFLDALDVNLAELSQLLQRPGLDDRRGHRFAPIEDSHEEEAAWQREAFLIGLRCLAEAADGLAHVH